MKPPHFPANHPDRHIECQEALESRILDILDEGRAAGWSTSDITAALVALADNIMLAEGANRQVDTDIEAALRGRGL